MADRSVSVILRAEVTQFKAQIASAAASLRQFGADAQGYVTKNSAQIETLSGTLGRAGLALTALGTLAVAKFADFDAAMSKVAATGQDARGSLEQLRDAAIDAGQRTKFSATEAAGGIEALAKAGVSAADILNGGLNGALDLAAAGNLDVAGSAEVAAIAMAQFGLSGEQVSHVADLLAAGAGKANGEVSDMAAALKQSGQVASQTGLSIEETTAALAAFAQAGLLGSDAGTSLKTMLQRLTAPAGEAAALMEELGISAYDASGQFVGLEALAGQLRAGLEGLTPAQRNAALATIFGADAVRAATVLYEQGADGIRSWTAAVNDQGYAAEVAAIQMDNLKGDLETLGGSVETALIGMGEASNGPLRSLVQGVTDVVNAFSQLPPAVQGGLGILVGGSGLILLGVAGLGKLVVSLSEARTAMTALGISTGITSTAMSALGKAIPYVALAALAVAVGDYIGRSAVATVNTQDLARELTALGEGGTRAGDALAGIFEDQHTLDFLPWVDQVKSADDAIRAFADSAREAMGENYWDRFDRRLDVFGDDTARFGEQVRQLDAALAEMVASGQGDAAADMLDRFLAAAEAQGVPVDDLKAKFTEYASAVQSAGSASDGAAGGLDGVTGALGEQAAQATTTASAFRDLLDAYDELNGKNLSLLDATSAYEAALDGVNAAIEANGQTTDLSTEAGRANVGVLTDLARKASDLAQATYDSTGSTDAFYASLQVSRQALADTAIAMGMSAEQAWAFVDSVLAIPPAPAVTPTVDTTEADSQLSAFVLRIDESTGTVTVNGNPVPAETTLGQLLGNVDASTGTVTIGGNRYPADTTLAGFLALTNTSTGTVTVAANTAGAEASINYTARPRSTTITVGVVYQGLSTAGGSLAQRPAARGGLIAYGRVVRGYAGGGLVPGVPPADRTKDNVLAMGPGGLFALRSQEFVATQESTARNYDALVAGNRGATLGVVRAGYAAGGAIGSARSAQGLGGMSTEDVRAAVRAGVAEALAGGVSARFGNPRALAAYIDAELTLASSRQAGGR